VEDSEELLQQRGRESVRVELADTSHEDRPIDAAQETEHVRVNAAKLGINVPSVRNIFTVALWSQQTYPCPVLDSYKCRSKPILVRHELEDAFRDTDSVETTCLQQSEQVRRSVLGPSRRFSGE
jgi:hypothetical protein